MKYKKQVFYVVCVYIPPSVKVEVYEVFLDTIEQFLTNNVYMLILGDFNCPFFISKGCDKSIILDQFLSMNNLTQCNVIVNHKQKFLDLIFTSMNVESVTKCMYSLVSKDPYHTALCMSLNLQQICDSETETVKRTFKYDYCKGDYFCYVISCLILIGQIFTIQIM